MKNIKIYPKEWLELHPYRQSDPVDSYYTNIANRIYDILEATNLANSFEKDDVTRVCLRMAAYFEDVISGLNIYRSFITEHKRLFGKYLPFYTPNDHYYDDEVNYEDVRFLLWHYTQQYHGAYKGTFVSPDNATNGDAAQMIYQLFCDEWTTAPENTRMQTLFGPETRYEDKDTYMTLLNWFHYQCYLFTDSNDRLTDAVKAYWQQARDNRDEQDVMKIHDLLPLTSSTAFLSYTSAKWLSIILPTTHPDHEFFVEIANQPEEMKEPLPEEEQEAYRLQFEAFQEASEGKLLVYVNNQQEFIDFATKIGMNCSNMVPSPEARPAAIYATPEDGLCLLIQGLEYIKDENNPFYDEKKASEQAISFFMIDRCHPYLLKELEERGMLADAQAKSLIGPERSKAIIHENWQFLAWYFIHE